MAWFWWVYLLGIVPSFIIVARSMGDEIRRWEDSLGVGLFSMLMAGLWPITASIVIVLAVAGEAVWIITGDQRKRG